MLSSGPLRGLRVVEFAGQGPSSFGAMLLADLGAEVLRLDRMQRPESTEITDVLTRGRRSIAVNLKHPDAPEAVLRLVTQADAVIEGFRPGVMERIGLGPEICLARNPRLVFGRMTGWGQYGPYSQRPGHDVNYLATSGALHAIGARNGPPVIPLNLVADFGGGGLLLAFGIAAGVIEARSTGRGQVVDTAMIDGVSLLMAYTWGEYAHGVWRDQRGRNFVDGGSHRYNVYETADGKHLAVSAYEDVFYEALLDALSIPLETDTAVADGDDHDEQMKALLAERFKTRTRDEWTVRLSGMEHCVYPVLSLAEAAQDEHNKARSVLIDDAGILQPAPAPRFSVTPGAVVRRPPRPGEHTVEALRDWGFDDAEIESLRAAGAVGQS